MDRDAEIAFKFFSFKHPRNQLHLVQRKAWFTTSTNLQFSTPKGTWEVLLQLRFLCTAHIAVAAQHACRKKEQKKTSSCWAYCCASERRQVSVDISCNGGSYLIPLSQWYLAQETNAREQGKQTSNVFVDPPWTCKGSLQRKKKRDGYMYAHNPVEFKVSKRREFS